MIFPDPLHLGQVEALCILPKIVLVTRITWMHTTNARTEQILYAVFRKIAYGPLKHLKEDPAGKITPIHLVGLEDQKLKVTLLSTYTGFDLALEDLSNGSVYTINERGYINRPQ